MNNSNANNLKYENYAIVYFDILGSKNKIKNTSLDLIRELKKAIGDAKAILGDTNKYNPENPYIIRIFSDNIFIAQKITEKVIPEYTLFWLLVFCREIQESLFSNNKLMSRGAATIGKMYIDEDFIIGDGLINVYELESKCAIYPRIIIDKKYGEKIQYLNNYKIFYSPPLFKDFDGFFFVNFLNNTLKNFKEERLSYLNDKKNVILSLEKNITDEKSKQKFDWLLMYWERVYNFEKDRSDIFYRNSDNV